MVCFKHALAVWTLCLFVAVSTGGPPANAQSEPDKLSTPDWGDYPLLMSQFGELCTMCEAYLRCTPSSTGSGTDRQEILYYFETKTFWGQIATIWDYFARWFDPVTSETRPGTIYRISTPNAANAVEPAEPSLSVADARIEIDGTWIDRETSDWFEMDNSKIGTCARKGIGESMATIATIWPELATENTGGQ